MEDLKAGDFVWIHTRQDDNLDEPEGHWFVVIFDLDSFYKNTIVIPINSYESPRHDATVRLYNGDHKVITRDSYVNYFKAKIISQTTVNNWEKELKARKHNDKLSDSILERIRNETGKRGGRTQPRISIEYWRRINKKDG